MSTDIIAMGTSRVLRLREHGTSYFLENLQQRADAQHKMEEYWKICCIIRPDKVDPPGMIMSSTWFEAHKALAEANVEVLKMMQQNNNARRGQ